MKDNYRIIWDGNRWCSSNIRLRRDEQMAAVPSGPGTVTAVFGQACLLMWFHDTQVKDLGLKSQCTNLVYHLYFGVQNRDDRILAGELQCLLGAPAETLFCLGLS